MICVVLPAAHSALDLCCLHSRRNYSILHWLFCCTLYWIFSFVQLSLLTFNICFDLVADSRSRLYCCLVISQSDMDHGICLVSMWEPPLPHSSSHFYASRFANVKPWRHYLSFLYFSSRLQLSSGDTVQYVLILCRVNTEIGLCMWGNWCEINISANTTPPGAFLWSIIYVVKRAKKLYLKINFFAFSVFFLSLKEMCVLSIYVDACDECQTREATWFRKGEGEIKSKKGEKPQRVVGMWG